MVCTDHWNVEEENAEGELVAKAEERRWKEQPGCSEQHRVGSKSWESENEQA